MGSHAMHMPCMVQAASAAVALQAVHLVFAKASCTAAGQPDIRRQDILRWVVPTLLRRTQEHHPRCTQTVAVTPVVCHLPHVVHPAWLIILQLHVPRLQPALVHEAAGNECNASACFVCRRDVATCMRGVGQVHVQCAGTAAARIAGLKRILLTATCLLSVLQRCRMHQAAGSSMSMGD